MSVSSTQPLPYPFESEHRERALDLSKQGKSARHAKKTGEDYLGKIPFRKNDRQPDYNYEFTGTPCDVPQPSKFYATILDAPSQEVVDLFWKSQNNLAFRNSPLNTPAMKVIYNNVWESMGSPTPTTHPEIAHPQFGKKAMWDIYPRTSPNYIKIKAIESYYCSQAIKNLRAIAKAFKAGKTSEALKVSKFLRNECPRTEILRTLPDKVYRRVWELMKSSDPYVHLNFHNVYWNCHPKIKASNKIKAQAVEDCIAQCTPRKDTDYQAMVKKTVPVEVVLQKALYAVKHPTRSPQEYCEQGMKMSTHAEKGLVYFHDKNNCSISDPYSSDEESEGGVDQADSQKRIYAIEDYLEKLATLKMGCIAEAFKTGKESLAYGWSAEFFSLAQHVRLYQSLEGGVYKELWKVARPSTSKKESLKHQLKSGKLAYWGQKGVTASAEQRAEALIQASRKWHGYFPKRKKSDSGSDDDSEKEITVSSRATTAPAITTTELERASDPLDTVMSYTNTALSVVDAMQIASLAIVSGPASIAIPCAMSIGGTYLAEKVDEQIAALGEKHLSKDGQEKLALARKYTGYGLTALRTYSVGRRLYDHGVGSLVGYPSKQEAPPVKAPSAKTPSIQGPSVNVLPKVSLKVRGSCSPLKVPTRLVVRGSIPAHVKLFARVSSHAVIGERGTINGVVTQPLTKRRNPLKMDDLTKYGNNNGKDNGNDKRGKVVVDGGGDSEGNYWLEGGVEYTDKKGRKYKGKVSSGRDGNGKPTHKAEGELEIPF